MKLYGKTFGDIYHLLPGPYKAVVVLGIAFILFIFVHFAELSFRHERQKGPEAMQIGGMPWNTPVYDPSLETDGNKVWLAFSGLDSVSIGDTSVSAPGVHLAFSAAPACDSWNTLNAGFMPRADDILAPDGQTTIASGVWRYETPSLVHDPDDKGREWKLYAYKYMWTNNQSLEAARRYGFIAARYASDPQKNWSTEEWVLSPGPGYPPPPYQDLVKTHLNTLDPSLAGITILSRPSVVSVKGALVMSLSAFTWDKTPDRIVLLISYDHGARWSFAGTALKASEIGGIGPYMTLGGATLLKQGEHVYLAAVLGDDKVEGLGTFVFGFEDLAKAKLQRDKHGVPLLLNSLPRSSAQPTAVGGGYAAYSDKCPESGVLTGEFSSIRKAFQIFETHRKLVGG